MNSTVPTKSTGDTLSAAETNNIVSAVNSKADIDPSTGHVQLSELPSINFSINDFTGDASGSNPISLNFSGFQAWLISLPNYQPNRVLMGDFTWGSPYTGSETQLADPAGFSSSLSPSPVTLNWTQVSGYTYTLQRSTNSFAVSWTTLATQISSNTFSDHSTVTGTTYQYRLKATVAGQIDSNYVVTTITTAGTAPTTTTTTASTTTTSGSTTTTSPGSTTTTTIGVGLNPIVDWPVLQFISVSGNTLSFYDPDVTDNAGGARSAKIIPAGGTAIVQFQAQPFTDSGEGSTGSLGVSLNTNLYGDGNTLLSIHRIANSKVLGKYSSGSDWGTDNAPLTNASGFMRIRTDGVNVYAEYSNDGNNWSIGKQVAQPNAILYIQVAILGATGLNQRHVSNIVGSGLTTN